MGRLERKPAAASTGNTAMGSEWRVQRHRLANRDTRRIGESLIVTEFTHISRMVMGVTLARRSPAAHRDIRLMARTSARNRQVLSYSRST
jgi:hypothetical protein